MHQVGVGRAYQYRFHPARDGTHTEAGSAFYTTQFTTQFRGVPKPAPKGDSHQSSDTRLESTISGLQAKTPACVCVCVCVCASAVKYVTLELLFSHLGFTTQHETSPR